MVDGSFGVVQAAQVEEHAIGMMQAAQVEETELEHTRVVEELRRQVSQTRKNLDMHTRTHAYACAHALERSMEYETQIYIVNDQPS